VDELSVSVSLIPSIKAAVRRQNLAACRSLARESLAMLTASEVRVHLTAFAQATGSDKAGKEADHA
jgi:phosphoenolpyruvate-protein kinase (PTS system EI component)